MSMNITPSTSETQFFSLNYTVIPMIEMKLDSQKMREMESLIEFQKWNNNPQFLFHQEICMFAIYSPYLHVTIHWINSPLLTNFSQSFPFLSSAALKALWTTTQVQCRPTRAAPPLLFLREQKESWYNYVIMVVTTLKLLSRFWFLMMVNKKLKWNYHYHWFS